jgi:hypothetical protein
MVAIGVQFSSLPINSSLQNNPRYQFSLKSENIEVLPIFSAAIRSRFSLVRIFYQSYLIYMPSLVEISLAGGHFESKMAAKIPKSSDLGKIWFPSRLLCCELISNIWFAMAAILNPKWPPKYKNPPIWGKFLEMGSTFL